MVNRRQSASATYILCPQFPQTYILFVLFPSTFPPQPSSLFLTTFTFVPPSTPLPPPRPALSLFSPFWSKFSVFFSAAKIVYHYKKKPLRSFLQISEPICGRLQISCQRNILENKSNLSKPFLILLAKEQLVTMWLELEVNQVVFVQQAGWFESIDRNRTKTKTDLKFH